jgi:hypothetical protein
MQKLNKTVPLLEKRGRKLILNLLAYMKKFGKSYSGTGTVNAVLTHNNTRLKLSIILYNTAILHKTDVNKS